MICLSTKGPFEGLFFCVDLFRAGLNLLTNKLGQYPHRFGKALSRPVYEPDITVEGVLSEIERSYTYGPFLMGCRLRH